MKQSSHDWFEDIKNEKKKMNCKHCWTSYILGVENGV